MKFCGCTSVRDAQLAVDCGVDAVGVIFAAASPRCVSFADAARIARAVPPFVSLIGVFVDPADADVALARSYGYVPQFSGAEDGERCETLARGSYVKVHHIAPHAGVATPAAGEFHDIAAAYPHATWMFDTIADGKRGGTGRTFDWALVPVYAGDRQVIVSGGLTPENVAACIRAVRPFGVDVRSGIETDGVKDGAKMRAFVRAVKEADEQA